MQIVSCPHCGTDLENDDTLAGRTVKCPGCQQQIQMPAGELIVRHPSRRKDRAVLPLLFAVIALLGVFVVVLVAVLVGVFLYGTGKDDVPKGAQAKQSQPGPKSGNTGVGQKPEKIQAKKEEASSKSDDGPEKSQPKENPKKQVEELERSLEERRVEKERRLAELDKNEAIEIAAIEDQINQIRKKMAANDKSMAQLVAQRKYLASLPSTPPKNPSRELMELEQKGQQQWLAIQRAYRENLAKNQGDLAAAEQRLKNVRDQYQKKRLSVVAGS